jgi:hypothetical protein
MKELVRFVWLATKFVRLVIRMDALLARLIDRMRPYVIVSQATTKVVVAVFHVIPNVRLAMKKGVLHVPP